MRIVTVFGLFLLGSTASALAADAPVATFGTVEHLRLERSGWSGFSGVLFAGGAFLNALGNTETRFDSHEDSSFQRSAALGGAVGYDHQLGSLVFGAHLEGMATNFRSAPSQSLSVENRWLGSATARIGFDAGRFMPYVSAGIGYGRLKVDHFPRYTTALDDSFYRAPSATKFAKTAQALVLGGGVEARIREGLFLRADYKHYRFEEIDFQLVEPRFATPAELVADTRIDVFNLGVGYRF